MWESNNNHRTLVNDTNNPESVDSDIDRSSWWHNQHRDFDSGEERSTGAEMWHSLEIAQ